MRRPVFLLVLALAATGCRGRPDEAPSPRQVPPARAPAEHAVGDPAPTPPGPRAEPELPTAGRLHYLELVTAGADPDAALPMIVAIHGLGDDPRGFAGLVQDFDRPARVILPRAPDAWEGGGWSWFPIRARDTDVEGLSKGIGRAAERITESVEQLRRERPTVGKPIVTGFSQGGMLSFALAVHHPDTFSAAYPVGGWLPPPLWPESVDDAGTRLPIVALHGDADPAVPLGPTQQAVAELASRGLSAELHVYPEVQHAIPPAMRRELHQLLREAHTRATAGEE